MTFVVVDEEYNWKIPLGKHLVLSDTDTSLDLSYFGVNNDEEIFKCFRVDFPRTWVTIDGESVTDENLFLEEIGTDFNFRLWILLACTQIAMAPIVCRLHNIYYNTEHGGFVGEIPTCEGYKRSVQKMVVSIDRVGRTALVQKHLAAVQSNGDCCLLHVQLKFFIGTSSTTLQTRVSSLA